MGPNKFIYKNMVEY